jgi:hypothetical protein
MSFFNKFGKGTKSRFTKPASTRPTPLPPAVEVPIVARPEPAPAKEHDAKAEQDQPLDETLIPPDVPVRQKLVPAEMKVQEGQSSTEPHTTSTALGSENIFQISWRSEANYRMIAEHHPETNYYVPSSLALFSLLEAAEDKINIRKYISQHEQTYNPYAVKVYYAYMYYFQILRARRDSGTIDGYENSLLKRFEMKFPMSSLPCAEITYGYFSTIIATELAEAKYDWIAPYIAHSGMKPAQPRRNTSYADTSITNGAVFLQPSIPHMVAILNTFIHHDQTSLDNQMIDGDTYIPVTISQAAGHTRSQIFGVDLFNDNNDHKNLKVILATTGVSTPVIFGNDNYAIAAKHARRTDFGRDINIVVNTTSTLNGRAGLTADYTYGDLDEFLLMPKTSNLRFFGYLRDQAVIHARFFDKVYHFQDVQTTGGLETTVLCQLKATGPTGRRFTDTDIGIGQTFNWYHQPFRTLHAGFGTNRAGLRRNEELQAFAYGTNALMPIVLPLSLHLGLFWSNHEWIQSIFFDIDNANSPDINALTASGKPMFTDHNSMALRCIRDKPHGTGVVDNEFN